MSTRRPPLSANPNIANSPIRSSSKSVALAKQKHQKRAYASVQREEPYGQPPPSKKLMLEHGVGAALRSPAKKQQPAKISVPRASTRTARDERAAQNVAIQNHNEETQRVREWQEYQRERFPKYVFYFESVPNDQRARLAKQLAKLGAREETFFSIDITHVITTRHIPTEKSAQQQDGGSETTHDRHHEVSRTINPSLLNRNTDPVKKKLFENASTRRLPLPVPETVIRQPTNARSADVLVRAKDMGKKIWALGKLQRMLEVLFEETHHSKATEESNLAQLMSKERTNGPCDRDPTVATKELVYWKGPYIFVYDIEQKQKPIMAREYAKVANKTDGDWPQFRTSSNGRCPFIEDDPPERAALKQQARAAAKQRVEKPAVEAAPVFKAPEAPAAKSTTTKRSLAEMENGQNRRAASSVRPYEVFDLAKATHPPTTQFGTQNAFTSRARTGRLLAGEPVASGLQPSNVTSAVRSQMISSATGVLGSKAGISKEVHGLQRKVLQKSNPTSQDTTSSRRLADMSIDNAYTRSASLGTTVSRKLDQIDEDATLRAPELKRTLSVPSPAAPSKPRRRDLKPGYCENCQDKFADFDEHILSRKHRKFADNDINWTQLDALLKQLERLPKYSHKYSTVADHHCDY